MAERNGCWGKTIWGCGCLVILILVLGVSVFTLIKTSEMAEPDILPISLTEQIPINPEAQNLTLPDGSTQKFQKARLVIRVKTTDFSIVPDSSDGQIKVSGEYDQANYRLDTNISEENGRLVYRIDFSKQSAFPKWIQNDDHNNSIKLHLPKDLAFDVDLEYSMGRSELDFSGLAVSAFKGNFAMSKNEIRMDTVNPAVMDGMFLDNNMGEIRLQDFQNFQFTNAKLDSNMGEVSFYNSGSLLQDTDMEIDVNMGNFYMQAPETAKISSSFTCSMGSFQGPNKPSTAADGKILSLRGDCSMGNIEINTGTRKKPYHKVFYSIYRDRGVDEAIRFFKEEMKGSKDYEFSKHGLRTIGYKVLDNNLPQDALKIFALNAELYPDYHKSWRAMAAAEYELGHYKIALGFIDKALEIEPNYNDGKKLRREIIQKIESNGSDQH